MLTTRRTLLLAALGAAGLLSHAGGAPAEAPKFGVRGSIEKVSPPDPSRPAKGTLGEVMVAGKKEPDTEVDRAVVIITEETRIHRLVKGKRLDGRFRDLKFGQRVEVKFKPGPRILIYPTRAAATEVVILES